MQNLNEDQEEGCDAVVEARVSPSGAPAETTTLFEEPKKRWSKRRSSRRRWRKLAISEEREGDVRSLVEVLTDTVNSAEERAQEWEEIEFLVDSGASATVVGDEMVRAVRATDPNPNANYRLADGSTIPNKRRQ